MGALSHTEFLCSPGAETLYKVCTGKQNVKSVHILGNTTICDLGITKLSLDNQERMLYFASNSRFTVWCCIIILDTSPARIYKKIK